ncbi:MAG: ketoacyl-ACP synthase III [Synergistaceae bacterium]|jgi:3-oxoacyl-[acyl-carrier-protein] synthase-3|nr:ketoacyl-ACP synthase III [Synergistaceae bacterium]
MEDEMKRAGIEAMACYLPERAMTNDDFAKAHPDWNVARAERATGIKSRRVEEHDVPASAMAIRAAEKLFETTGTPKAEIDFTMVVTQSGDYRMPATACLVQHRLGLPQSSGAMDINQGCAGYVYGLAAAKALAENGSARKILLITVEKTTFFLHPEDSTLRLLQGDAAAAALISPDGAAEIGAFDFGTDGSRCDNIIVPYGGSAEPMERENGADTRYAYPEFVNMKGMEIFNFSVTTVPKTIAAALQKNGLEPNDIDYYLFHQANGIIVETIGASMKIPAEKIPMNIDRVGNTSSCSIPLLLDEIMREKKPGYGSKILLCGFGVGLSWGTTVLSIREARP